ncbi:MAG: efflux RND transporter permease subunit, partial [Pseudobdellovibrio sp.]
NVILAIPVSLIGSFIVLHFLGFTINTFTLMGLSLSIGIVVDDAIMVLENIVRHKEMGKGKVRASLDGSKEITFAAMAATISIVAIFLPVVFMTGIIGKYFFQFGVTITVAVLLSLLEALTLTPMRSSQFVDSGERHTRLGRAIEFSIEKTTSFYQVTLKKIIKHPWSVLSASILFFAASMFALNFVNKEFIPSEDQSRFNIRMKTKLGTSLMSSDRQFREVEKFLASRPEISRYVVQVGGGSPGDANNGSVLVTMKDVGQRGIDKEAGHELSQLEFMDLSRKELKKIKGVKVVIQDPSARSFSAGKSFPVEFTIQGPDWDQLAKYSDQMMGELEKTDLVTDLDSDYQSSMPEIQVVPDRKSAAEYGVSILNISQTINATIGGAIIGQYPKDGHRNDIRLKLEDKSEDPYDKIKNLYIRNYNDELVPLAKLVKFEKKTSMLEISRRNRERAITIDANVKSGKSQQEALTAVQNIAKKMLDPKYHVELSGSSNSFNESFQSLILALILGLAVAYMVLASQFNSLTHPLAVLIALPFSVSGAFVALWLSHKSLNIYSMIGLILLMGIVKKNSILLVDFTNQVKAAKKSLSVVDALLEACPIRLRPILMTSVATIAGAVPAALALGPGAESRIPMAISVIGGVIVSTVLTLYVVPCAYLLMWREPKVVEEDHH